MHVPHEQHPTARARIAADRGAAMVLILFAISVFSAAAVAVLENPRLESNLRAGPFGFHLAFSMGDLVQPVEGPSLSWKVTTAHISDGNVEAQIPVAPGIHENSQSAADGWTYSTELAPGITVCCDSGDGSCRNPDPNQPTYSGSVNREADTFPTAAGALTGKLRLVLASAPPPLGSSAPDATGEARGYYIVRSGVAAEGAASPDESQRISCTLMNHSGDLAQGVLDLRTFSTATSGIIRDIKGNIDLTYARR